MMRVLRVLSDQNSNQEVNVHPLANPPAYLNIFQVSTATTSFLASSAVAFSITCLGNTGLSTPYRRIIFGLGVADMFQSFAFMTGPLAVPPSKMSGAAGTEVTSCKANGFILHVGALAFMFYAFFLCVYYLYKLKYKMSDNAFRHKIETKFHIFIVVLALAMTIAALELDTFHVNGTHFAFCNVGTTPTLCAFYPDIVGDCDPTVTKHVIIMVYLINVTMPTVCFVGIIVSMGLLYHHAFVVNRAIEKESLVRSSLRNSNNTSTNQEMEEGGANANGNGNSNSNSNGNASSPARVDVDEGGEGSLSETPQDRVQHLSRLYRREITIQATSYVAAFCITYVPTVVAMACAMVWYSSPVLDAISIFTYPMGGFLNVLVYTRPKIAGLRRNHPEYSHFRCFWLVLRAGGEIPSEDDLALTCCQAYCCNPTWIVSDISQSNTNNTRVLTSTPQARERRRRRIGLTSLGL